MSRIYSFKQNGNRRIDKPYNYNAFIKNNSIDYKLDICVSY